MNTIDQNDINLLMFLKSQIEPLAADRTRYNRIRLKKTKLVRFIAKNGTNSAMVRTIEKINQSRRHAALTGLYQSIFERTLEEELYSHILGDHISDWEVLNGLTAHTFSETMFEYLLAWHNREDILAKKLSE